MDSYLQVASLLLSEGGDVDAQSSNGNTALINAVSGAHSEVTSLLLSMGADTDIQNVNGNTALHISCAKGMRTPCTVNRLGFLVCA